MGKNNKIRTYLHDIGANYLKSVFWTLDFAKKYWISMKILSPKILDFYENTCQNTGLLENICQNSGLLQRIRRSPVQYFDKYFYRRVQYFGT